MACLERLLYGMELTGCRNPLNGDDLRSLRLQREHGTGLHCAAVEVDGATSALRCVATDVGTLEAQMLAQQLHKQGARIYAHRTLLAVHRE